MSLGREQQDGKNLRIKEHEKPWEPLSPDGAVFFAPAPLPGGLLGVCDRAFLLSAMAAGGNPPFLAVEIQLFYKAKTPRPKDKNDFEACLPRLSCGQRDLLRRSMMVTYGVGHSWLAAFDMLQRGASY